MRHGQGTSALYYAILFALAALFIILLLSQFKGLFEGSFQERKDCRLSVDLRAATTFQVVGQDVVPKMVTLDCKRRLVTIGEHNLEVNGKEESYWDGLSEEYVSEYDEVTQEVVYNVFADEMAGCWWQFMEGKENFLGEYTGSQTRSDERACFICSEISFSNDVKRTPRQTVNFVDFAEQAVVAKRYSETQPMLYDYILNEETLCNSYLYSPINRSRSCIENYFGVHVRQNNRFRFELSTLLFFGPVAQLAETTTGLIIEEPVFSENPVFDLEQQYIVLFVREGGSWMKRFSNSATNKLLSFFSLESDDQESSTYFVWIQEKEKLPSADCKSYFA